MALSAGLGLKIYRYRTLIRRRWWVLALTIGLGLAYEGYVILTKPQLYESSSQLLIREELLSAGQTGAVFEDRQGQLQATAAELLRNNVVLEKAKARLALDLPGVNSRVEVTSTITPRTNIFSVKGIGASPEYTQRFVDTVVEEFLKMRRESRDATVVEVKGGLNEEITKLRTELAVQEEKFQNFVKENNMAFWQEQAKSAALFLSGLKNQDAQLRNELQRLQNLTPDQLLNTPVAQTPAAKLQAGNAPSAGSTQSQSSSPFNSELYAQYTRVTQDLIQKQSEVEQWKTIWKPKHPKMQALQLQVDSLQRLLNVIKDQNATATTGRIAAIGAELKSLEVSIANWEKKVQEAGSKDAEYQTLLNTKTSTQNQIEKLVGNSRDIAPRNTSPDPLVVMNKATPPQPVPAGAVKHIIIGLIGGLVVGMIILIVLDRADDRLTSSTEMLDHFSEPILGQIPNVADTRKETGLPLLQPDDERYTYAEAFRSLRSSLIFMPNQAELKTILITSAIPNEGKSTIASNLAVTMAASGARILLVDADLRRGDLAQLFDTDGRLGLSSILRGEVHWKEVVQTTKYPSLSLIPRGPVTNQSGELLLKPEILTLLEDFKENYDLTIFNTAPILAADDTPTLAPNFDGALMVIRAQFTSARLSKNALNTLYQRQVNVLGLILNAIDTEMPDYYYYRYPKYYAAS